MTVDKSDVCETRNTAVAKKDAEVSCWNCLSGESYKKDVEPIPLYKVRKQHREKLRLYSFLAAQVTKPRAVSLKQRVSENYSVAKKIDERIMQEKSTETNFEDFNEQQLSSSSIEVKASPELGKARKLSQVSQNRLSVIEKELNSLADELKKSTRIDNTSENAERVMQNKVLQDILTTEIDQKYYETVTESNVSQKIRRSLDQVQSVESEVAPKFSKSPEYAKKPLLSDTQSSKSSKSPHYVRKTPLLETGLSNNLKSPDYVKNILPLSKVSFQVSNSPEDMRNSLFYAFDTDASPKLSISPENISKNRSIETEALPKLCTSPEYVKKSLSVDTKFPNLRESLECDTKTKSFNAEISPKLCKSPEQQKKTASVEIDGSPKFVRSPEYLMKNLSLSIISHESKESAKQIKSAENVQKTVALETKVHKLSKSPEYVRKPVSSASSPDLSKSPECIRKSVLMDAEGSPKLYKLPEHVKVVSKVLVETSTPKIKSTMPKESDTQKYSTLVEFKKKDNDIIEEIDEIDVATNANNGRTSSTCDKVDNASFSGSDSGYAESSTTGESKENASSSLELSPTPDPVNKSCLRQDFKSSLPALTLSNSIAASSTSLYIPRATSKKTSEKYIRWSTLSIHQKPISFGDETYISETVSPGHATLPRRSNSPLPHERDLGDRFSLNRSGLQARSESMASVYSGAGEGTRNNVTVRGDVQFSLLYNYRLGALEVGVRRCRDLAPVDTKRNRSDPYVKVYLLPDKSKTGKRKTKVKKNTLNPIFEETLSFVQPLASLSSRTLWLSVWHADMFGRNDFLGEVTLPLADVVFDDPAPMWYKLHERTEQFDEQQGTRGDIIIGLKFELPEPGARAKGTLHVLVKEAKNVVATKPNGLADVFCKSYLLPERGRLAKQKTSVCRRTLNPRWEHTFTYRGLSLQELGARALELSLWDRDRLASNDFMGAVRLSLGTGTYMGANVNWMDSVGKEVSLWQTMMQRPNFWVEGSLPLRPQLNHC